MQSALELDGSEMMKRNIVVQQTKNKTPASFGQRQSNNRNHNNSQGEKLFNRFKDQSKGTESTNVIVRNLSFKIEEDYLQ